MNPIPLALRWEDSIPALTELMRRAIDGTVLPIFVDITNQVVIIGASSKSSAPSGKLEVTGDVKVLGAGNGLILPCRNGLKFGRVILENPDANGNIVISCDPL